MDLVPLVNLSKTIKNYLNEEKRLEGFEHAVLIHRSKCTRYEKCILNTLPNVKKIQSILLGLHPDLLCSVTKFHGRKTFVVGYIKRKIVHFSSLNSLLVLKVLFGMKQTSNSWRSPYHIKHLHGKHIAQKW